MRSDHPGAAQVLSLFVIACCGIGCAQQDPQAEPERTAVASPRPETSRATSDVDKGVREPRAIVAPSTTGRPGSVLATPEGHLLVKLARGQYRVLRSDGKKLSPVMHLDAGFDMGVGFTGGFVVTSWVEDPHDPEAEGTYDVLLIDLRGRVHPTSRSPRMQPLRSGDVTFRSTVPDKTFGARDETLAYRPSARRVFRFPTPVRNHLWERDERGWLWSCPNGGSRGTVWWSRDGARSWHRTEYRLGTDRGPSRRWTLDCRAAGGRIAMLGYFDDLPTAFASGPLDGRERLDLPMTPFDERLNSYAADLLPDGRLVFGTRGRGLQVADNLESRTFTFWPGPVRTGACGRSSTKLIWCQGQFMHFSTDGRTWSAIDPT